MRIVLARIDDRFIHGQVTVGWGQQLRPNHIILANNEIAADSWQCRVYRSSVAPSIRVSILSTSEAAATLRAVREQTGDGATGLLLTGNPQDMLFLHRHGRSLAEVNVGGMHYQPGKQELLPFVYVDDRDVAAFRAFLASGTLLQARQVPGARTTLIEERLLRDVERRL